MGLLTINANAADIYVNSSGQAGSYPTLAVALAAANNGDRILVSNIITLTETDTINKSVTIISTAPGDQFELTGDLYVEAIAGLEIRIIGLKQTGDIYCLSGTASGINGCNLYIIDSEISGDVNCDISGLVLNLLYSNLYDNLVTFNQGQIIGNEIGAFYIAPGDSINYNDTVFIIANKITGGFVSQQYSLTFQCDYQTTGSCNGCVNHNTFTPLCLNLINTSDHFFFIANNFLLGNTYSGRNSLLFIASSNSSSNGQNSIFNNTFINIRSSQGWNSSSSGQQNSIGEVITFYYSNDHSNTILVNNLLGGAGAGVSSGNWNALKSHYYLGTGKSNNEFFTFGMLIDSNYTPVFDYNITGGAGYSSTYDRYSIGAYPNTSSSFSGGGVFDISQNYILQSPASINIYKNSGKPYSGSASINSGKNSIEYYDIDMTRNDIGTYGGPYSWDNYWNTASGSARIYNLNLPFEILSGQPNVKADAVHQK